MWLEMGFALLLGLFSSLLSVASHFLGTVESF